MAASAGVNLHAGRQCYRGRRYPQRVEPDYLSRSCLPRAIFSRQAI